MALLATPMSLHHRLIIQSAFAPSSVISRFSHQGNESGIISQIAGVFARRGYTIESLAVGSDKYKDLFTIIVIGTENELRQVVQQFKKLVNLIKVEDISRDPQLERELMLLKLGADPSAHA